MLLTVTRLSLSHAGLPSQSVGVWGVPGPQPPEANVKWFSVASPGPAGNFTENAVSKFSVTTPCASPTRVDTERLAERETLLYRLGSKLNRIVSNSCGNSLSVAKITRDFCAARFFWRTEPFTPKKNPKKEVDYFWKHQTSNSRLRYSI